MIIKEDTDTQTHSRILQLLDIIGLGADSVIIATNGTNRHNHGHCDIYRLNRPKGRYSGKQLYAQIN